MKYTLYIDTHELKLIDLFKTSTDIDYKIKQLEIGDIFILAYNPETNIETIEIIIERKTYADLYASITGGRYNEQKIRLKSYINSDDTLPKLVYLIEGDRSSNFINFDTIDSAILGTSIRDGFTILYSTDLEHTYKLITKLYTKIPDYLNNKVIKNYLSTVKICKKDNMTPDKCYIMQLACIPNLSITIAENIAKYYPSLVVIIDEINNNELEFFNKLKEIKSNNRKIGPVLAKKIIEYIKNK